MVSLFQIAIKDVKKDMDELGIPYNHDVPIFINGRYSRALGKCYYQMKDNKRVAYKIGISKELVDYGDANLMRNTICHELIHSAPDCVYAGHGGMWKVYAQKMNRYKGYHISRLSQIPDDMHKKYKYIIECQKCHTKSYLQRHTQAVEAVEKGMKILTCKKCGSKDFKVIEK